MTPRNAEPEGEMPATITVPTLENLELFIAQHRALYGDSRMEASGDAGTDDGADTGTDSGDDATDDASTDETAAEARIKAANDEAAKRRVELKPWKDLATEFGMTPAEVRDALAKAAKPAPKGKDDAPPVDEDKIRREERVAATAKANSRIVSAEVRAAAADLFADPADAPLYLDLSKYDVDEDGAVDVKSIVGDLKDVLKAKPHLGKTSRPKPDPSQGKQGGGSTDARPGMDRMRHAYATSTSKTT